MEQNREAKGPALASNDNGVMRELLGGASVPPEQQSVLREVERHLQALHRLDSWLDRPSLTRLEGRTDSSVDTGDTPTPPEQQLCVSSVRPQAGLVRRARGFLSRMSIAALMWAMGHARLLELTYQLAITDSLTGLFNRRHFDQCLTDEWLRAARYGHPISLIMLDIDHFKLCNDQYGHSVGDQMLVKVASVLRESVRSTDVVARYGGDEFAILLPETDGDGARVVAGKVRRAVQDALLLPANCELASSRNMWIGQTSAGNRSLGDQLTISVGVATCPPGGDSRARLLLAADRALYRAKSAGRNCVWGPRVPVRSSACAAHHLAGSSS